MESKLPVEKIRGGYTISILEEEHFRKLVESVAQRVVEILKAEKLLEQNALKWPATTR